MTQSCSTPGHSSGSSWGQSGQSTRVRLDGPARRQGPPFPENSISQPRAPAGALAVRHPLLLPIFCNAGGAGAGCSTGWRGQVLPLVTKPGTSSLLLPWPSPSSGSRRKHSPARGAARGRGHSRRRCCALFGFLQPTASASTKVLASVPVPGKGRARASCGALPLRAPPPRSSSQRCCSSTARGYLRASWAERRRPQGLAWAGRAAGA